MKQALATVALGVVLAAGSCQAGTGNGDVQLPSPAPGDTTIGKILKRGQDNEAKNRRYSDWVKRAFDKGRKDKRKP